MEPQLAAALSEAITEMHDPKNASEVDRAQIATLVDVKAFARELKLALAIQALAIVLAATTLLRLIP
ncbi:hypothetical protein OCH239_04290 [Roseivivax halodurans JCM 10272]|uniref:Uncharacterized protein n=1 Tax=Roseivivax halodurans JCM 10272 TaxID=1449350 RepID=X7EGG5_9RHOB|nr:hypothetical protein [Roseivivax halodurans]ETX14311.1 hypothetical protein OCH239_04290 [Roseivivax halodurans JCM 10272]